MNWRPVLFIFFSPFQQFGPIIEITSEFTIFAFKWKIPKLCRSTKTCPVDLPLAFLIRLWEGSMALKVFCEVFMVLDEPKMPVEIHWWSGRCIIRIISDWFCCNGLMGFKQNCNFMYFSEFTNSLLFRLLLSLLGKWRLNSI
jgi:hypothetical protein